jgi:ribosomal protein S19
MSRSKWKGFFILFNTNYQKKILKKNTTVLNLMKGKKVEVYNGKNYYPITVTRELIGFKYGEFLLTRKIKEKKLKKDFKKKNVNK